MSYVKTINEDGVVSDIMAKALESPLDATLLHKSELEDDLTQTTAGINALDAAQGKVLNDAIAAVNTTLTTLTTRLNGMCTLGFNIPANGSITLTVNNSARFMIMGTAPNTNAMLALLCSANGTGSAITVQALHEGSYITHADGQNAFTLSCSHSSHSPKCVCIMFNDTPTVSIPNS